MAIRIKNFKGIRTGIKKDPNAPWQLYDLATDRAEKKDIASSHPEIIAEMNRILNEQHQCSHLREWEFNDPKTN